MPDLLRFNGAAERDPAIDTWFDARTHAVGAIARTWFTMMRERGTDVRELLHDGFPTVCVDDAPFAYVGAFRAHVNVGFFHGEALTDPAGLLVGTGRSMRHVKVRPGVAFDEAALDALITAAYRDIVARVREASTQEEKSRGRDPSGLPNPRAAAPRLRRRQPSGAA